MRDAMRAREEIASDRLHAENVGLKMGRGLGRGPPGGAQSFWRSAYPGGAFYLTLDRPASWTCLLVRPMSLTVEVLFLFGMFDGLTSGLCIRPRSCVSNHFNGLHARVAACRAQLSFLGSRSSTISPPLTSLSIVDTSSGSMNSPLEMLWTTTFWIVVTLWVSPVLSVASFKT
jgi:hypothetical protein